jgi:ABC-type antimicrobial peptide transport system permease subunit
MKFTRYIWNNIRQKKGRTFLIILGVILSVSIMNVMSIMADWYSNITNGFFTPFEGYNQIVSRGSNYFSMVPGDSIINQSLHTQINETLDADVIPCLLVPNDPSVISSNFYYIMGIPYIYIEELWGKNGIYAGGHYPANSMQILCGQRKITDNGTFSLFGTTVEISGVLNPNYNFLDGFIICDLSLLQNLTDNYNTVSIFFVDNSNVDMEKVTQLEIEHPEIDFLTNAELASIKSELPNFVIGLQKSLSVIANLSSIIFVFTIVFINILSRNRDIVQFKLLSMPTKKIFLIYWIEVIILLISGIIIGIPLSILEYIIIFSVIQVNLKYHPTLWAAFVQISKAMGKNLNFSTFINPILFILGMGSLLAFIPVYFGMRGGINQYTKERL